MAGIGYNVFTLVDNDKSGLKANKAITGESDDRELYANLLNYDFINDYTNTKFLLENMFSEDDLNKYIP